MTQSTTTLAQISDLHLPFPNWPPLRFWNAKRTLGLLNWHRGRRFVHRFEAAALLVRDMQTYRPDHIAVTGDLVNLGLPQEYHAALDWLKTIAPAEQVSVIPGNHDIYCPTSDAESCRSIWSPYMQSDSFGQDAGFAEAGVFPFMRRVGPVALIGVNSAVPTLPFIAHGHVGEAQLADLKKALQHAAMNNLFSCVLIHHPPLPAQAPRRRALTDAGKMAQVIKESPVGLVLYGHNHRDAISWINNRQHVDGKVAVCGAATGSAWRHHKREPLARYYLYEFRKQDDKMTVVRITRGLRNDKKRVVEIDRLQLLPFQSQSKPGAEN